MKWLICLLRGHQYRDVEKYFPAQYPSEHHGWLYGYRRVCAHCDGALFLPAPSAASETPK